MIITIFHPIFIFDITKSSKDHITMVSVKFALLALVSLSVLLASPSKVSAMTPEPNPTFSSISIVGVVFCTSAESPWSVNYTEATPIKGAAVRIGCFDTTKWKYTQFVVASGDNGYFYINLSDPTCFKPAFCQAYLDWTPDANCRRPIYSTGPYGGAPLYLVDTQAGNKGVYSPGVLFSGRGTA